MTKAPATHLYPHGCRARTCLGQMLDGDAEDYRGPKDALDDSLAMQATQVHDRSRVDGEAL